MNWKTILKLIAILTLINIAFRKKDKEIKEISEEKYTIDPLELEGEALPPMK